MYELAVALVLVDMFQVCWADVSVGSSARLLYSS